MSIKAVLFDLDGTLLPVDNDELARVYFERLTAFMAKAGYSPGLFGKAVMRGIGEMMKNDGNRINEAVFWEAFISVAGEVTGEKRAAFDEFYRTEFPKLKSVCGYSEAAGRIVKELAKRGISVVIATQPVFPKVATEQRIAWAGIDCEDIKFFTTFENSSFCKPCIKYYEAIIEKLGIPAEECLMVGNDADEDMVAENLGMHVYLVTDDLINRKKKDISSYNKGSLENLNSLIEAFVNNQ